MKHARSIGLALISIMTMVLGLLLVATPAHAHPDKSDVMMYGTIDCWVPGSRNPTKFEPATRVRFQTDLGEGVDAKLGAAPPGYTATKFSYTAQFYNIPETFTKPNGTIINGVDYNVYVTCRNAATPTWGARFNIPQKGHPHLYFSPLRGHQCTGRTPCY